MNLKGPTNPAAARGKTAARPVIFYGLAGYRCCSADSDSMKAFALV
jgi:hypothetical protein